MNVSLLLGVLGLPAWAYETDQLTERAQPLADATTEANARMNGILDEAVAETNAALSCAAPFETTRARLARAIHRRVAQPQHVWSRGLFGGVGFGAYSAWLETAPIPRRSFDDRRDVFGSLRLTQSLILHTVGTCSTIRVADILVGTDKFDHFLDEGYHYAAWSDWGAAPAHAVEKGTQSERSIYGMLTSNAFSYADLRANWDGYRFYVQLLRDGSPLRIDERGCVARVRNYDWAEYIDGSYDEVLDPPVFTRTVNAVVQDHVRRHRDTLCTDYARWGPEYESAIADIFTRDAEWIGSRAPARVDTWRLAEVCANPAM